MVTAYLSNRTMVLDCSGWKYTSRVGGGFSTDLKLYIRTYKERLLKLNTRCVDFRQLSSDITKTQQHTL